MKVCRNSFSGLMAFAVWLLGTGPATAAPRLVVVDLSPEALPAPFAELKLGEEIGRVLEAAGCRVERTCTSLTCARENTVAPDLHVLSFDVRYDRQKFACSMSLDVRDRPGGRIEYREKASSPVCPAAEALEDAKRAARVACDELRKSPARAVAPASARAVTPPSDPGPALGPEAEPEPAPTPRWDADPDRGTFPLDPRLERPLSIAAVAGGAAALAGAVVLLVLDGNPTSCATSPAGERVCTRTRQTALAAVPLIVFGVGGVGWGSWKLLTSTSPLAAGLGPRGLAVGGTF